MNEIQFLIYEANEKVVSAEIAQTTQHGAMEGKTQTKDVKFYSLDAIISIGYRVNSRRPNGFRNGNSSDLLGFSKTLLIVQRIEPETLLAFDEMKKVKINMKGIIKNDRER